MKDLWNEKLLLSPSLITLDLCNLEAEVKKLEKAGYPMLHVDILDGHFSPSMPLGLDTVKQLRKKTNLPFDCHVMTDNPHFFVEELIHAGADQIVFQLETADHPDYLLNRIHEAGIRAGIALKPGTPLSSLEYLLDKCDVVLLMLINPGYASSKGEKQVSYGARKVRDLKKMIDERGLDTKISLDGRISKENMQDFQDVADIFVCGSTCMDKADPEALIRFRENLL